MRKRITYWLVTGCWLLVTGYCGLAQSISPQLVGTTGNYSTAGFGSISSSVGEPVVTTTPLVGGIQLTQGFQQPFAAVIITGIVPFPNDTICKGDNITLVASISNGVPPVTYSWAPTAGLSCSTCQNPVASPTITTNYTLTVTDAQPSSDTKTITITVLDPVATITVTPNDSICSGSTVTLTASASGGLSPYTFTWMPGSIAGNPLVVTPTGSTTYTVLANDKFNCNGVATQSITVIATPTVSISGTTTLCTGNSTTLTASGGSSYSWWNTSQTTTSITVSPTANTTYTVTGKNFMCTDTKTISVTVNPTPTVSISGNPSLTICNGQSTTLIASASAGSTYLWSQGGTTSSITVNPTTSTAFTSTVTVGGCSASDTKTVTVNPIPSLTVTASPSFTICNGSNASLTATGATTYLWSPAAGLSNTTIANPIANPTTTTNYTVTGTTSGCAGTKTVTITVNPTPTVSITGTSTICNGNNATLGASVSGGSGFTYAWNTGPTTSVITVTPTATTGYTVTVTNSGGCTGIASATITVNPIPTLTTTASPAAICNGASSTLNVSGASTYTWAPAASLNNANLSNPVATPTATITYTVNGTANGCVGTNTVTVTVNPIPTLTISASPSATICNGSSTTLSASGSPGGNVYVWNPGGTATSITVSPTTSTNYTITASNAGCTAQTTFSVTVNPTPTVSISPASTTICSGGSTTLTASGAASYAWTPATNLSNPAISNPVASPTATITYTVNGTTSGCAGTNTVTVNVVQPPDAASAGPDQLLCGVTTSTLAGNTPAVGSGLWSVVAGTATVTTPSSPTSGVTGLVVGSSATLRWTISNPPCASSSDDVIITVNPTPTVSISGSPSLTICNGQSVTLSASASTGSTYLWSQGSTTSSIIVTPTSTTAFTTTVTANGCSAADTKTVTVNSVPSIPTVTATPNPICSGNTLSLTANSSGSTYSWNGPAGFTSTSQNPNIAGIGTTGSGTYSVTSSASGCTSTAGTISVTVNPTPAAPPATNTGPVCLGQPLTLNAGGVTGATSYAWTGPNGFTSSLQNTVIGVSTTAHAGTYSVTASSAAGCTSVAGTTTVVVNETPAPSAGALDATLCVGEQLDLTASSTGHTYSWMGPNGFTSNVQNPTIGSVIAANAGTYSVVATNTVTSCSSTAGTVSITVNPLPAAPTASATPNPVCEGTTLSLSSSVGATYSWSGPGGFSSASQTPTIGSIGTADAGSYSVTITDGNGCASPAGVVTVTVNTPPAVSATFSDALCAGSCDGTATVSPAGGTSPYTFLWDDPGAQITSTASGLCAGNYSVLVTDAAGCTATTTVSIGAPATLTASIAPTNVSCNGGTNGSATATPSGGIFPYTYNWSNGQSTSTATGLGMGTYTLTLTDANLCSSTFTVGITEPAVLAFNPPAGTFTTSCSTSCDGNINSNPTGGTSPYTYLWSPNGETTQSISGLCAQNYTVTLSDMNGCSTASVVTIAPGPVLTPSVTATQTIVCAGDPVTLSASGGTSYSWNTGALTSAITVNPTGNTTYTVSVSSGSCTRDTMITINTNPAPPVSISSVPATLIICNGSIVTLTGNGANTYSWSVGSTGLTVVLTPTATTTYSVIGTDGNGCTNIAAATVTVNPLPTITITGGGTICSGNTATLTASGGTNYAWNTGATTSMINPAPTTNTNYSVVVTDANGCTNDTSFLLTVNPGLTASITGGTVYCLGDTVTFTAFPGGSGETYLWSPGAYITQTVTDIATTAGIFPVVVTVTNAAGCSDVDSISVTVNPGPAINVTATKNPLCLGDSSVLSVTGGTSYLWSTGSTSASITVTPSAAGAVSYTVTASGGGCTTDSIITLTVNNLPTALATGPSTVCAGSNATLTASGGVSYAWSIPSTQNPVVVTPSVPTGYTVTVTDVNGCSDTASIFVSVAAAPTASITPSATSICAGTTITLTASGGTTYSWINNGTSVVTLTDAPTANTTYTLVAYNGSCADTTTQLINVSSVTAAINGNNTACVGGSVTLTASSTGGTAPLTYAWSTGATVPQIIEPYSSAGSYGYTVTITDATGCSGTNTFSVSVTAPPTPTISAPTTLCLFSATTLTAGGGGSYSWSTGATSASITITPLSTGTSSYTVTVTNGGCSADTSVSIAVLPLPIISASVSSSLICPGDMVTLTGSGNGVGYQWVNQGAGNPIVVTPSSSSTYTVIGMGANGCFNLDTVGVNISTISVNAGTDITICPGFTAHLLATVSGDTAGTTYLWSPFDGSLNDSSIFNPSANPDSTTVYALEVFNGSGCWAKDSVTVFIVRDAACVIHVYNGITPNGDGTNDIWWIDGIQSFPDNKVDIYNRWGTKVWGNAGYNNADVVWKGTNQQGEALPDGTYYYIVELYDKDGSVLFSASRWVEVTH